MAAKDFVQLYDMLKYECKISLATMHVQKLSSDDISLNIGTIDAICKCQPNPWLLFDSNVPTAHISSDSL